MWEIFSSKEKTLKKRWDKLYRVAYACCHNPDLAADLVQDTLEKAMRKQQQLKKLDSLDSWLFSILFNCWRDYCRRNRAFEEIEDSMLVHHMTPQDENERARMVRQVQSAVARLKTEQRQVITLIDLGGMRYQQVAEILDIPIGTVMSRLARARRTLKQHLNALLDNELDADDKAILLTAIQDDTELALRYSRLRQIKDMLGIAYAEPLQGYTRAGTLPGSYNSHRKLAIVAALFLLVGTSIGWFLNVVQPAAATQFASIHTLDIPTLKTDKILLHINSMDTVRIKAVLDTAEEILSYRKSQHKPVELEIVANASGIGVLRQGSTYARRIKTISGDNQNVSFLACGIAKKIVKLKEGKEIELIPEALDIPAALDRILNRVEQGWLYVRG